MAVFPTLHTGSVAKYPLGRGTRFRTGVGIFTDMSEQRFSKGNGALASFSLVYNNINTQDKETLREFFNTTLGSFDASWQLTLPDPSAMSPTTYHNLQFVPGSTFKGQNTSPSRWRVTLMVRQTNATNPPNS